MSPTSALRGSRETVQWKTTVGETAETEPPVYPGRPRVFLPGPFVVPALSGLVCFFRRITFGTNSGGGGASGGRPPLRRILRILAFIFMTRSW